MYLSDGEIKVILSPHAMRRCAERGIAKEDIEKVCRNPIQTVFDSDRKNFKSVGKIEDKYYPADTYLVVIHTKEVDRVIHIISAMYTSQGGLPRFGFSNL